MQEYFNSLLLGIKGEAVSIIHFVCRQRLAEKTDRKDVRGNVCNIRQVIGAKLHGWGFGKNNENSYTPE